MKIQEIARDMRNDHKTLKSWRLVGLKYGINKGLAYNIAIDGLDPQKPKTRQILGLPPITHKPAPVCQKCGELHLSKRCPRRRLSWNETPIQDQPPALLAWRILNREEA